jgi:hypothetical protein
MKKLAYLSLCHGMECKDYYALMRHKVAVLYGQER